MDDVAGKSQATDQREERFAFEEIIDRISGHSERVLVTATKLETVGTRVMGTLPERDSSGAKDPGVRVEPDGLLDKTLLTLNRLDTSFAKLESAALRLERL